MENVSAKFAAAKTQSSTCCNLEEKRIAKVFPGGLQVLYLDILDSTQFDSQRMSKLLSVCIFKAYWSLLGLLEVTDRESNLDDDGGGGADGDGDGAFLFFRHDRGSKVKSSQGH